MKKYCMWPLLCGLAAFMAFPGLVSAQMEGGQAELVECRNSLDLAWQAMERLEKKNRDLEEALAISEAEVSRLLAAMQDQTGDSSSTSADAVQLQVEVKALKKKIEERDRLILQMKSTLLNQREQIRKLEGRGGASVPVSSSPAAASRRAARASSSSAVSALNRPLSEPISRVAEPAAPVRQPERVRTRITKPAAAVTEAPAPVSTAQPRKAAPPPAPPAPVFDPEPLLEKGAALLEQGDLFGAESSYLEILKKLPAHLPAKLGLANCYFTGGALTEAASVIDEVLKEDKKNPDALGLSGVISLQKGDAKEAVSSLEKALKYRPDDAQLHNYLGMAHYARGKTKPAIKALEKAVELNPSDSESMFNLAVLFSTDDDPDLSKARQYYEASLKQGSPRDEGLESILYAQ